MDGNDRPSLQRLVPLLQVSDMETTLAYYREALGFELDYVWPDAREPKWAQVSRASVSLMFTPDLGTSQAPFIAEKGNGVVLYVWVDRVDALYAELAEHGAIIVQGLQSFGMRRQFSIGDPNGYVIAFSQEFAEPAPTA